MAKDLTVHRSYLTVRSHIERLLSSHFSCMLVKKTYLWCGTCYLKGSFTLVYISAISVADLGYLEAGSRGGSRLSLPTKLIQYKLREKMFSYTVYLARELNNYSRGKGGVQLTPMIPPHHGSTPESLEPAAVSRRLTVRSTG